MLFDNPMLPREYWVYYLKLIVQEEDVPNHRTLLREAVRYTKSLSILGIKASKAATRCHFGIFDTIFKNPSECVCKTLFSIRITVSRLSVGLLLSLKIC
nr:hypothetical protein [uncultured bacterium]